jgi:hypothetical protein
MKQYIKSRLVFVLLIALTTVIGVPGLARAAVIVDAVLATQYNNLFVATVIAHVTAGENLAEVDLDSLKVNDVLLDLGSFNVQEFALESLGAKLWKIVKKANVVKTGDRLTADVSASAPDSSDEFEAICGRSFPRLRITTICR